MTVSMVKVVYRIASETPEFIADDLSAAARPGLAAAGTPWEHRWSTAQKAALWLTSKPWHT